MLDGVARSFAFGAILAAAVGPIALLIMAWGVRAGLRSALAAGLGAALADLTYALAAFFIGSAVFAAFAGHERTLRLISGAALVGVGVLLIARAAQTGGASFSHVDHGFSRPLVTTYMLTLANPLTVVVFATFAAQLPLGTSRSAAAVFALSLFFGSLLVQTAFAAGGASLSRLILRPGWIRALTMASGAAVAGFGVTALMRNAA